MIRGIHCEVLLLNFTLNIWTLIGHGARQPALPAVLLQRVKQSQAHIKLKFQAREAKRSCVRFTRRSQMKGDDLAEQTGGPDPPPESGCHRREDRPLPTRSRPGASQMRIGKGKAGRACSSSRNTVLAARGFPDTEVLSHRLLHLRPHGVLT